MDNHILFDYNREELLPFTYTRPVSEIRVGILTIKEHYELLLDAQVSFVTEKYLSEKFPTWIEDENLYFNGAVLPTPAIIDAAKNLKLGQSLFQKEIPIALFTGKNFDIQGSERIEYKGTVNVIKRPWDIFSLNEVAIKDQYRLITHGKNTIPLSHTNTVLGKGNVFVEEGARVECAMINAENGPVYIGKNTEIMMGAMIRGPFALCEGATVKMGAKIYGATTVGPYCKVGGELNNSVLFGYSNKGHDGFLGNSVLGEWCNLGADTNNSNLKNNYSSVKVWDYTSKEMIDSKLQFCGLFMGDHSKCSINSMLKRYNLQKRFTIGETKTLITLKNIS
jgi:UDP-N-acetylglucosamine diphosphorylase/glucosamine-1-phosphate N-acetyltransferase